MAKVMISLPDELLARIDAQAAETGSNRSATLRGFAETVLGERQRRLNEQMKALEGLAQPHDGDILAHLRADRGR